MKIDIYPEKAQYITGEPITIIIECPEREEGCSQARIQVTHLQETVFENSCELVCGINELTLKGMDTRFGGFGVYLAVYCEEKLRYQAHTSFDVVSDSKRAIRYGFLSDFHTEDGCRNEDISNLRKLHINMVQYYDWSYRHDRLVSEERVYKDMMGREVDLDTVRAKINTCRKYGMKSLGYGAVYAASKAYYENNKDCALYTSAGAPLVFIDTFYIMNISRGCRWREHIINEYAKAVSEVGFDGIHMDTYGFPKTAFSFDKKIVRLDEEYPSLIEDTKASLDEAASEAYLIFNNVGNWPVGSVARAPQAAVYIEVWEPFSSYAHIRQIIRDARRECEDRKPVILAAYLEPFRTDSEDRAVFAALLLTAAVTVNGAAHLLLGEENAVLTQGYYVEHSFLSTISHAVLRSYYDFLVQYMELFFDKELKDVSQTHTGWDNTEYKCFYDSWSVDGEADRVWLTIREKDDRKLISLINLCGNDAGWNAGKNEPQPVYNIRLQVQIDKEVKGVYSISPDENQAAAVKIEYKRINTDRGYAIQFDVPYLRIWSNVWIDF